MICVIVLVGIPAAGKTTFCKNFIANQCYDVEMISYDDLCVDYTSQSRQSIYQHVELLIRKSLHNYDPLIILIDDNMYYKSMRKQYESLCRQYELSFFHIFFQVGLKVAVKRNLARINKVPDNIIIEMYQKIEIPQNNVLVINSEHNGYDINSLINHIEYALKNPLKPHPVKIVKHTHTSQMHNIDLLLRKLVADKIVSSQQSLKYVLMKQVILKHIKAGHIVVKGLEGVELLEFLESFFIV